MSLRRSSPTALPPQRFLVAAVVVWLVLASCSSDEEAGGVPDPPFAPAAERRLRGVVLILVDALRADHLGSYGSELGLTPNLDRLAARSWVFDRAVTPSSWTRPALASLLTSRYPTALGVLDRQHRLSDSALLLPEILREYAGFRTFAVSTNGNTNQPFGFDQGYDEFIVTGLRRSYAGGYPIHVAEGVTQQAVSILGRIRPRDDFFLFLHYVDPHDPYLPHPGLLSGPEPPGRFDGSRRQLLEMERRPPEELTDADYARIKYLYAGEVRYCDEWIGVLLDRLAERGLEEETMVVVTADHGEGLWDHGWRSHGHDLYEETVHVPLIVHLPGRQPSRVGDPVSLVDVAPTVLAALGLPAPEVHQGADLLPLARGRRRPAARSFVYSEMEHDGRAFESIRHGASKLIRNRLGAEAGDDPGWQLFDLERDPDERQNLFGRPGSAAIDLRQALRKWSLALIAEATAGQHVRPAELDRQTLDSLRALGYIGAEKHRRALTEETAEPEDAVAAGTAPRVGVGEGWRATLDWTTSEPGAEQVRGAIWRPAPGASARLGRRATVFLKRRGPASMWSLAFAADLDAESAETLTLQVVADRAEPAVVTVHESGHYLLRGRLLAGGGDPVPIELSCTRRKEGEPATGEGRDGCLEIGRIGLI